MQTAGLIPDQRLASLQTDADGNWIGVPEGQTVVPLIKLPKPAVDPLTQKAEPFLAWASDKVERSWVLLSLSPEEQAAAARKVWPTSADYLIEFTFPEMASISLSTDPTIAALRLLLASWSGEVWSDDTRVQAGLAALVSQGIITEARREAILAK